MRNATINWLLFLNGCCIAFGVICEDDIFMEYASIHRKYIYYERWESTVITKNRDSSSRSVLKYQMLFLSRPLSFHTPLSLYWTLHFALWFSHLGQLGSIRIGNIFFQCDYAIVTNVVLASGGCRQDAFHFYTLIKTAIFLQFLRGRKLIPSNDYIKVSQWPILYYGMESLAVFLRSLAIFYLTDRQLAHVRVGNKTKNDHKEGPRFITSMPRDPRGKCKKKLKSILINRSKFVIKSSNWQPPSETVVKMNRTHLEILSQYY